MKIFSFKIIFLIFLKCMIYCKNSVKSKDIQIELMERDTYEFTNQEKIKINKIENNQEKNFFESEINNLKAISKAFMTIFLSGLFDKSFFITALMAMKFSDIIVISSATFSLSFIGIISVFLGLTINKYIPAIYIDFLSIFLFLIFGASMIYDGMQIKENSDNQAISQDEENQEKDIDKDKEDLQKDKIIPTKYNSICKCDSEKIILLAKEEISDISYCKKCCKNEENLPTDSTKAQTYLKDSSLDFSSNNTTKIEYNNEFLIHFQAFSKTFLMIFFGEIGDRSQISTIYLTANFDKFVVITAVISSSLILSIVAVYGGVLISNRISEKKLTIFAGFVFILFAVFAVVFIDKEDFKTIKNMNFTNTFYKSDNFLKSS